MPHTRYRGLDFERLQEKYSAKKQTDKTRPLELFTDPTFPPTTESIVFQSYHKSRLGLAIEQAHVQWRRAPEICEKLKLKPKLVVDGVTLLDVNQGFFDNCWYVAGVSHLALRPELFRQVVPDDQDFEDRYAGIFHFKIWRFGEWHDVIVDDYLPCYQDRQGFLSLFFLSNRREPNEFWAALLEKAYAKLHGCYEALEKGYPEDAMVDMTGGVGYRINVGEMEPAQMFQHMKKCAAKNSLFSCSTSLSWYRANSKYEGKVAGHAYTITKVVEVKDNRGQRHQLIRLRNPLGKMEWDGQWSDHDTETWQTLDQQTRQKILTRDIEDGEYWMSFGDFLQRFYQIQVCFIPPSATSHSTDSGKTWNLIQYPKSNWIYRLNAGGPYDSRNPSFWFNPQFIVDIPDKTPNIHGDAAETVAIVSLMKINNRKLERQGRMVGINFDIFQVGDNKNEMLTEATLAKREVKHVHYGSERHEFYTRELSAWLGFPPGRYYIVPSSAHLEQEADFLLRVFMEASIPSMSVLNLRDDRTEAITAPVRENENIASELFSKYANGDEVLDAYELQPLLNEAFVKGEYGK